MKRNGQVKCCNFSSGWLGQLVRGRKEALGLLRRALRISFVWLRRQRRPTALTAIKMPTRAQLALPIGVWEAHTCTQAWKQFANTRLVNVSNESREINNPNMNITLEPTSIKWQIEAFQQFLLDSRSNYDTSGKVF